MVRKIAALSDNLTPAWLIHFLWLSTISRMGEEDSKKRRHHSPEQIVRRMREADRLLGEGGKPLVEVCSHLEVTEATHYRWRHQFGGTKADDAKRSEDLEKQNVRLKRLVAKQALDLDMLTEVK